MTPAAETFFVENIGGDAQLIANELEKLDLYCSEKKKIDVEDLEGILSCGHTATIFNFVDGIGQGNVEKALRSLESLLSEGVYPLVILKMVARQFRLLSRAKEGLMKGEPLSRIVQGLNMKSDYIAKGVVEQARGWPVQGLGGAFEEILQSDCLIKSSRIDRKLILESLVFKLERFRNQPFA